MRVMECMCVSERNNDNVFFFFMNGSILSSLEIRSIVYKSQSTKDSPMSPRVNDSTQGERR